MHQTVNHFLETYLSYREITSAPSTFRSERSKATKLSKLVGERAISSVTYSDILQLIQKLHTQYANKTINEFLIILRAIFKYAQNDGVIPNNPMEEISNLKIHHEEPEPFTLSELVAMNKVPAGCESGKNLFQLGVLTGLRISELLALSWEMVDFDRSQLHVKIALVDNIYKTPKTEDSLRVVELCQPALEILQQQHSITGHKKAVSISVMQSDNKTQKTQSLSMVFYNSKTNRPFLHAKQFNKTYFTPLLKSAGVKHRGVGQLRHTFASQSLTAGISKEWIARQMGQNSTAMIDIHYGRWMSQDAPNNIAAVAEQFSSVFGRVSTAKQVVTPSPVSTDLLRPIQTVMPGVSSESESQIAFTPEQIKTLLHQHPQLLMQCITNLLAQSSSGGSDAKN
ncbi:site-specific integrase [Shewanella sp. ULN5]|uniref:tyrosine-type recombinase/integrase n=1 Tax=Shewanella sp. ULN5 TaxID=2994678 RepID=UPI00273F1CC7|nr:site-specific integrase [Shewanella sp. ULN5]MDP5145273.1 site-specific integrase [Shewanella sp. ULN5]